MTVFLIFRHPIGMLKIQKGVIKFKNKVITQDISFTIKRGEIAVITGDSGKGKTSLLNAFLGFYPLSEGFIQYNDVKLSQETILSIRKKLAWLPQSFDLGRSLTKEIIYDIFEFHDNKRLLPQIDEIKKQLNLLNLPESVLKMPFNKLSGGEKQRIGLLVCLLLKRDYLFLDEPSSALDKKSKLSVFRALKRLKETVILTTSHDKDWIKLCSKRIKLN